jgi:protein-tyrosine phosphatase
MIPLRTSIVVNLSRTSHPVDLKLEGIRVVHQPLTYWETSEPWQLLERVRSDVKLELDRGERVFVHCRLGVDRSGILALAYLATHLNSAVKAIDWYKKLRPNTPMPRNDAMMVFQSWWEARKCLD